MIIRDVMSLNAASINVASTMKEAADLVSQTATSDLMVVDSENNFVGVLSEGDLIRAVMPKLQEIIGSGGSFLDSFDIFIDNGKEMANTTIESIVIKSPISFAPSTPLLKAASTMVSKQIRRLPVVEGGKLVGTISRADVCRGVFAAGE
jgi:CBS domain-containing protein